VFSSWSLSPVLISIYSSFSCLWVASSINYALILEYNGTDGRSHYCMARRERSCAAMACNARQTSAGSAEPTVRPVVPGGWV
ncbi:hypothetical protein B0H14DRAFT_3594543, partial [Mycena olivaceomarginata]